jgi:hypothetical protein
VTVSDAEGDAAALPLAAAGAASEPALVVRAVPVRSTALLLVLTIDAAKSVHVP